RPFLCAIARVLLLRPRPRLWCRLLGGVGLRLRRSPRLRGRLRLGLRLRRGRLRLGLLRLGLAGRCALRLARAADRLDRDPGQLRAVPARLLVAALGLNLNTLIFSPRRCSTTCTETAPSSFERSVTTSSPPVIRTSGVNASPAACDCRSTRSFWPSSTRYCLPPILITAYMSRGMVPERRARSATQDLSQQAALALARVAAVAVRGDGGGSRLRGRIGRGLRLGSGRLGRLLGRRPPPRPRLGSRG